MAQTAPLLALGTLDAQGRPWATILGGEVPLAQQVAPSVLGIRGMVSCGVDPVVREVFGGRDDGEVVRSEGAGRMISGLTIDLEKRTRVKLYGRMIAGACSRMGEAEAEAEAAVGNIQLVVKIEQSLGNCPKYLNQKRIRPVVPEPKVLSEEAKLGQEALDLIESVDMFFLATADHDKDMDSNHRGGPPGFVRVEKNHEDETVLIWPEYSGNNLYQTLGNLLETPKAGIVFPNFETGDVLFVTGDTEVLVGKEAADALPRSNLAVKLHVKAAKLVANGLPFRGDPLERSPYNPKVRYLKDEKAALASDASQTTDVTAKLIKKEKLTPSIARFTFAVSDPNKISKWRPGQYAAFSFYDELYMGYSHMKDDDPLSINDDFLRTFTISSRYGLGLHNEEFEVTIRNVGSATAFLSRQNERTHLELPLLGVGGDFVMKPNSTGVVPFIAGGIGITPLLAALPDLDAGRLRLYWTLSIKDIGLVHDTFTKNPNLPKASHLFLTGDMTTLGGQEKTLLKSVQKSGAHIEMRRLRASDLEVALANDWYSCTGPALRKDVLSWLPGKNVMYEDFNY